MRKKRSTIKDDEYGDSFTHNRMNNLSTDMNNVLSRRNKVFELACKGHTQSEIATTLGRSQATISRDWQSILESLHDENGRYVHQFYTGNEMAIHGIDMMLKKLWSRADDEATGLKELIQIESLILRCYDKKQSIIAGRRTVRQLSDTAKWLAEHENELKEREKIIQQREKGLPETVF